MLILSGIVHKYDDETVFSIDFCPYFVYIYIVQQGKPCKGAKEA